MTERNEILKSFSSFELRSELEHAFIKDLLGPAGSDEEEVNEQHVYSRYLVGMLAPKKHTSAASPKTHDEEEDQLDLAFSGVGLDDELALGGDAGTEDGVTETSSAQKDSLLPSSIGMTFVVSGDVGEIVTDVRWGKYERTDSETVKNPKTGDPKKVWKRRQVDVRLPGIALRDVDYLDREITNDQPDVRLQGFIRRNEGEWIVTLFIVNNQFEPAKSKDLAWLFQVGISVEEKNGLPVFRKKAHLLPEEAMDAKDYQEYLGMEMLYRDRVEFAVGHGTAVHAEVDEANPQRAVRLSTTAIPRTEVPKQTPPTPAENPDLTDLQLDMKTLAELPDEKLPGALEPLIVAYRNWVEKQRAGISDPDKRLGGMDEIAGDAIKECEITLSRIAAGIELLRTNVQAAEGFRFANKVMYLQRVRSIYSERIRRGAQVTVDELDVPVNRSWYPFQLGFILLNLPGITDLHHPERSDRSKAIADLLWFPTGGGKTEAYLGLAAYTMGLRRLQGVVGDRIGDAGVSVLMRYTLRLLTLQQFQRAATLICACEFIRKETGPAENPKWGKEPFRIGLWVGYKTTPNTTDQSAESVRRDHGHYRDTGFFPASGSPYQLSNCPWCGTPIDPGKDIRVEKFEDGRCRTFIFCGDSLGRCPFTARNSPDEGIPLLVVDEEIYRRLPALLIATVDKFAQMPWNGKTQMLFGNVNGYCPRHGYRSPEIEDSDSHPRKDVHPAVKSIQHPKLRPPDLIIQDELHLITGPLGTLVGLYETAVDQLSTWSIDGKIVRPKVIASTATVRRAKDQVKQVFLRNLEIFPPAGIDVEDNFFSVQRKPDGLNPGRLYLGICAPGIRLKAVLIRVYTTLLSAAQQLYEQHGASADAWMTLVGYFNSLRELGGMRRLVDDDIHSRLFKMDERGLSTRRPPYVEELTSRMNATDIPRILDLLETEFDPVKEAAARKKKQSGLKNRDKRPIDTLLATNMISVGVDVKRLGLMVVSGQPKSSAEYIQATSRIGRSLPGLVVTIYNWARPRDLSHYEQFEHYHSTFYKHVEALSVTPFSRRALDRGLTGILVSIIRLIEEKYNENQSAGLLDRENEIVDNAINTILERAGHISGETALTDDLKIMLKRRIDEWLNKAAAMKKAGSRLGYKDSKDGRTLKLLIQAGFGPWDLFTCLNSLRDVENPVNLILHDGGLDD